MQSIGIPLTIPVKRAAFKKISDQYTDYGKAFRGTVERCTAHWSALSTGISIIDAWIANQGLSRFETAVTQNGGKLVRTQFFKSEVDYQVVVDVDESAMSTDTTSTGLGLRQIPWTLILYIALALILVWLVIKPVIDSVTKFVYGPSGTGGLTSGVMVIIAVLAVVLMGGFDANKGARSG